MSEKDKSGTRQILDIIIYFITYIIRVLENIQNAFDKVVDELLLKIASYDIYNS